MRNRYFPVSHDPRPVPWRLVILVFVNTVALFGLYAFFVMRYNVNWLFWVYFGALVALALAYVLYNHAFADAACTYESLPSDWSHDKKHAFLMEIDARKKKSKWLLSLIFPLCLTLMFDIIYLFFGEMIVSLFDSLGKVFGIW